MHGDNIFNDASFAHINTFFYRKKYLLQLTTKEKEIIRLRKMLEGGRSYAAVSKNCTCCRKMEKKIDASHDTEISEVRILQHAKLELEQQLKGK